MRLHPGQMPNISATFVDAGELTKKSKEIDRGLAAESRIRLSLSTLRAQRAELLNDIANLKGERHVGRRRSSAGDLC